MMGDLSVCQQCGLWFLVGGVYRRRHAKFCSSKCRFRAYHGNAEVGPSIKKDEELRELRALTRELLETWEPRSTQERVLLIRLLTALCRDESATFSVTRSSYKKAVG